MNAPAVRDFIPTTHHDTYPLISPTTSDLTTRFIAITGASKGIGRALAVSYASAGASGIALLARGSCDETKTLAEAAAEKRHGEAGKIQVVSVKCDTTSQVDVERAAKEVSAAFEGKLDILINNAGYLEEWNNIVDSDPDEWWKTWEVNIKGTYLVCRSFVPLLLAKEGGLKTVVTNASIAALMGSAGASAYQASKTAQLRMMGFVNEEHGDLLAYTLHPGSVKTGLAMAMPEHMHAVLGDTAELGADTTVWLTRERREWLRGRFVDVRWDMGMLEERKGEIEKEDLLRLKMAA
jgi:NAD(P)-dependent dehydrogenase (short-subunit alcohol dehydrogenase family)